MKNKIIDLFCRSN